jgi:hypothetical protein
MEVRLSALRAGRYELLVAISYRQLNSGLILSAQLLSNPSYRFSLYELRTDHTENTASIVDAACLPLGCLATDVLLFGVSVLLGCVYRRVAW